MKSTGETLHYREDFLQDPASWRAFAALLETVFGIDITVQERLGGPDQTSMPIGYFTDQGECVASFNAFSMPLMVDGRQVAAAGWQSVAVHPDWRGQGLFRRLADRMIERCDAAGFQAILLSTDKPGLYAPYGFEIVPQHVFEGPVSPVTPAATPARHLDLRRPADLSLLMGLLSHRMPVSQRFAPMRQAEMFLINAIWSKEVRLDLLPSGVVVAWAMDGAEFVLLDIVGPTIPDLQAILSGLSIQPATMRVCFPPDRLEWDGAPVTDPKERGINPMHLAMRGETGLFPKTACCLSPMAEF